MATIDEVKGLYRQLLGRDADAKGLDWYQKFDTNAIKNDMMNSGEYKTYSNRAQTPSPVYNVRENVPTPTARPAFSSVMPYDQVFSPELLDQLAASQINPELSRQQASGVYDYNRGLAQSGGYMSGRGRAGRQDLADAYSRQGVEQRSAYKGQIEDWTNDWYNKQAVNYGTNPLAGAMPTLPTFDQFKSTLTSPRPTGTQGVNNQFSLSNLYRT